MTHKALSSEYGDKVTTGCGLPGCEVLIGSVITTFTEPLSTIMLVVRNNDNVCARCPVVTAQRHTSLYVRSFKLIDSMGSSLAT